MNNLLAQQVNRHNGSNEAVATDLARSVPGTERGTTAPDEGPHGISALGGPARSRAPYDRIASAGAGSDVTRMELRETLALLAATMEATTDGILVLDRHGRMLRMNRRFIELWRVPEEVLTADDEDEALGFILDQLEEPQNFLASVAEVAQGREGQSPDALKLRDGRIYERSSSPMRVEGTVVGQVWSFRDVTACMRLEEQLRQAQKMEAIGSLAGGIAHDFNNLLTVIAGSLGVALEDSSVRRETREDLDQCLQATERAAALTGQLLAFARRQVLQPQPLDLNRVVAGVAPMLARLIGPAMELETRLEEGVWTVLADRSQLEQVIINLVVNARDAMATGGRLTIGTRRIGPGLQGDSHRPDSGSRSREAELWVADTGSGIAPELIDRIFEPFFTTKGPERGTGLGLATVYGIVAQSGGRILVESEVGRGTTFRIRLPANVDEVSEATPPVTRTAPNAVSPTVLVVDDAAVIRRLVGRSLEQRGYRVITAADGQEAVGLARANADAIDLVLTDVVMPQMGGSELAAALRMILPDVPIILTSGAGPEGESCPAWEDLPTAFLPKPFTLAELWRVVDGAFRAAAA